MFKPLAVCIGLRYTRSKRSSNFISFISLTSMLGIALGVAVLITVLSVMNGFDEQIQQRFFGMAPQVTVSSFTGKLNQWPALQQRLLKYPGVEAVTPYISGQGLLAYGGDNVPVMISGIIPKQEQRISELSEKMVDGRLSDLKPGSFGIVLGGGVAKRLGVEVGEKVLLMIPQATVSLVGVQPRFKRFTVTGIFTAGGGFGFDSQFAFINLEDAQKLFMLGQDISGLRLKITNIYRAPEFSNQLEQTLPEDIVVSNWTAQFGAFFKAVKMEKTMMFLILILIIAVAAFNLISSLVMIVNDKQADIAILRTFGARPKMILATFMVQGSLVGLIGTFLGTISGITLALNATALADWLQNRLNVQLLSSNVYFVDFLPSKLEWLDVIHVCAIALLLSFLATIYPAWRASRTQPAEALRYD